ncbi:MAG: 3-octaprenyl-4-hydroxybenzoate decarboxylase, partial [Betaproteobacteria bacterium]|nr:3-octaprenyl-4-hydroxybenzoate decarboxylase [Betaproteobacteria bacterium]
MHYRDLRDFIAQLESQGELRRIAAPVDPHLEMTALSDRSLQSGGPAFLFERPEGRGRRWSIPALTNLFGTTRRVALGMGANNLAELRDVGRLLA